MKKVYQRIYAVTLIILMLLLASCGKEEVVTSLSSAEESSTEKVTEVQTTAQTEPAESTKENVTEKASETEMSSETEPSSETDPAIDTDYNFTVDDYPVVDGSTATKPLAKAFYEAFTGIQIEDVDHSKTHQAYLKLINKEADLILVVDPSEDDLKAAEEAGVELQYDTVVNEAFVFFVNTQNPVQSLTLDEIRGIYSGRITNWKEVGGDDEPIIAYQRPVNSGSQTGMLSLVMGDEKITEAPKENIANGMMDIVNVVSDYDNGKAAIGYSYYYYANTMYVGENCRMLSVEGVVPSDETIISQDYPILTRYLAVTRKDDMDKNTARLLQAMLSDQGQRAAKKAGYVPVRLIDTEDEPEKDPADKTQKTLDLDSFYDENSIVMIEEKGYYQGIQLNYYRIDGLKDAAVQQKVNEELARYVEACTDETYEALGKKTGMFWNNNIFVYGSFSDILSVHIWGQAFDGTEAASTEKYLTLDLHTGETLSLYDLFVKNVKAADVMKQSAYESLVRYLDNHQYSETEETIPYDSAEELRLDISKRFDRREELPFYVSPNGVTLVFADEGGICKICFDECPDEVVLFGLHEGEGSIYDGQYAACTDIPAGVVVKRSYHSFKEWHEKREDHYTELCLGHDYGSEDEALLPKAEEIVEKLLRKKEKEGEGSCYLLNGYAWLSALEDGTFNLYGSLYKYTFDEKAEFEEEYQKALSILRDDLAVEPVYIYFWDLYPDAMISFRTQEDPPLEAEDFSLVLDKEGNVVEKQ